MPINFVRITGLIASLYAISVILLMVIIYLAEQAGIELPNFGLIGELAGWGVMVLAFRRWGQALLQSPGHTILSVD